LSSFDVSRKEEEDDDDDENKRIVKRKKKFFTKFLDISPRNIIENEKIYQIIQIIRNILNQMN